MKNTTNNPTKHYPIWHPFSQKNFTHESIKAVSAKGAYITLENGQELLDMVCSWWVTLHGHSQPEIAEAMYNQALKMEQVLFANYPHQPAIDLCESLLEILPNKFSRVFFSDNGSTAVEVALKMAFQYWFNLKEAKRKRFMAFESSYHGDTVGAMSVSDRSIFSEPFNSLLFSTDYIPFPETFDKEPLELIEEKENKSLSLISQLLDKHSKEYAALIIEPLVQGAGGMRMCRPEFLQKLEKLVKNETLLIYDEVFVGFGRTGDWFASSKASTQPDIICLSKGITGGFMPLSVTVCQEIIYKSFQNKDPLTTFYHGHSYTANPIGCAAANASMKLLRNSSSNFQQIEAWHRELSEPLKQIPEVKQIRYCGTIFAFDIQTENKGGYLNPIGKKIQEECLKQGIFIRPLGNVIYLVPPYCIIKEELKRVYSTLLNALLLLVNN